MTTDQTPTHNRSLDDRLIDDAISDATDRLHEIERDLGAGFDPLGTGCDDNDRAHLAVLALSDRLAAAQSRIERAELEFALARTAHRAEVDRLSESVTEGIELAREVRDRLARIIARRPWWSVTAWLLADVLSEIVARVDAGIGSPPPIGRTKSAVLRRIRREERTS